MNFTAVTVVLGNDPDPLEVHRAIAGGMGAIVVHYRFDDTRAFTMSGTDDEADYRVVLKVLAWHFSGEKRIPLTNSERIEFRDLLRRVAGV